ASASTWIGVIQFSVPGLVDLYGIDLALASSALTAFLVASMLGTVGGGFLADWTKRHDMVLVVAFLSGSILLAFVGTGVAGFWVSVGALLLAGGFRGSVGPARDLLVRRATPEGAIGPSFAFVTLGFVVGQTIMPPFYGWILDNTSSSATFYVSAVFGLVAIAIVLASRERSL
ncbi:MAG: MFS transporter, partial [Alphaproteobacteria bacterium]